MSNAPEVQAARKKMQLARLEAKKGKDYPAYYAAQPMQVVRAQQNAKWREARTNLKAANLALEVAEITGEGLVAAQEAHAIAALVAERAQPRNRSAGSAVSLVGA